MKIESVIYQVKRESGIARKEHKGLRIGQSLFNALDDIEPELASKLHATDNDPFYDDEKIDNFWKFIYQRKLCRR